MSFGKTSNHSFLGQADTEFILASVKEQEIQFERLTRELEEEHLTVAGQLQQCQIEPNNIRNAVEEELHEGSDTESKRDSAPEQDQTERYSHPNSSATILQSPAKEPLGGVSRHYNEQTESTLPCTLTSGQSQSSHVDLKPASLAHPRPYYASPPRTLVHDQPPFPTHFSPPVYQAAAAFQYSNIHPTAYYVNIPDNHVPYSPGMVHLHNQQLYPMQTYHQAGYTYFPDSQYQVAGFHSHPQQQQYDNRVPPKHGFAKTKPPVPPRKPSHNNSSVAYDSTQAVTNQVTYKQPPKHYSTPNLHDRRRRNLSNQDRHYSAQSYMSAHDFHNKQQIAMQNNVTAGGQTFVPVESLDSPRNHRRTPHQYQQLPSSPRNLQHHEFLYNSPASLQQFSFGRDPSISEVIQMLRHPSYQVVSNAAAYIQHITYGDDHMKAVIRSKGVIPLLVNLLHHHVVDAQRNACGALRNMVYGKSNDEAKHVVRSCGGISSLAHVLRNTDDQEMKELITGVLWNMSSCDQIKTIICDSALSALAFKVVIHYVSLIEPYKMAKYCSEEAPDSYTDLTAASDFTIDPNWSALFVNATGCLRNISSAGVEVRRKMRDCDGLIEALLLVIENVIGKSDVDSKGVENCMCILRNLSYRLALEVEGAHVPISRDSEASKLDSTRDEECWRRHRRKSERKKLKTTEKLNLSSSSGESAQGVELLWKPEVVRRYLAILAETCNYGTLEAASGAMQNLSAGQWVWSANIRSAVRKEKGLPMLVEFLHMDHERIVTVMCSALRNMALDVRNKQLIGKHAMQDFVDLLPDCESASGSPTDSAAFEFPHFPPQKALLIEAVCGALRELITSDTDNANRLHVVGAVPKLVAISRSTGFRYPHRLVKAAGRVLATLWDHKGIRSALKREGWSHYHFAMAGVPSVASVGSQVTPYASPPLSPDEPSTYREQPESPTFARSRSPASSPKRNYQQQGLQYMRAPQQYAPLSPLYHRHQQASSLRNYRASQPDSNYVTIVRPNDDFGAIDTWV